MKPLQTLERLSNVACELAEAVGDTAVEAAQTGKHLCQTANIHSLSLLGETWIEKGEEAKAGMKVSQSLDAMRTSPVEETVQ